MLRRVRSLIAVSLGTAESGLKMQPDDAKKTRWTLRLILLNVCIGQTVVGLDQRAITVALPTLTDTFHTAFTTVQWVVLVYDLILIGLIITMGRLGDLFGRRRFYSIGFLVFVAASALCGISQTVGQMIFFRAIQAIGGSMIAANGRAIVSVALPREERGRALGLTSTAFHIGFLTGPSLGGFLIDTVGWRWIFYINLPIALWGAYLAWKIIPETKAEGKVSVDIPGAILLLLTNGLFIYAIDLLPRLGWRHPMFLLTLLLSLIAMAFLLVAESKARTPILILSMFRSRLFSAGILSLFPDYRQFVGDQFSFALLFAKPFRLFALSDGLDYHRRFADHHVHGADCRHLIGPAGLPPAVHHRLRRHRHRAIFRRLARFAGLVTKNHAAVGALGSRLGVVQCAQSERHLRSGEPRQARRRRRHDRDYGTDGQRHRRGSWRPLFSAPCYRRQV